MMSTRWHGIAQRLYAGFFIAGLMLMFAGSAAAQDFDHTHAAYDAVLKAHVANGMVDYKTLKADPKALDWHLATLAAVSETQFKTWDEPKRLAYLANLYNAATLRLILNHYPLKSIKDIGSFLKGPWDQPAVRLFGKTITLNNLEHDILRKKYNEPRLHLALVCAAKGCPPLRSEAYTAERLNEQLDHQARTYLASPAGLRIDRAKGETYVSSIFKWYGKDFVGADAARFKGGNFSDAERGSLGFISRYASQADRVYIAGGNYKVRYLDYDWSLNER